MKKLIMGFSFLCFCFTASAEQTVLTATPESGQYKFVWSGDTAVMKKNGGKSIRCKFQSSKTGVDEDANAYASVVFQCSDGFIALKQLRDITQGEPLLLFFDHDGTPMGSETVSISKKTY